ncbi:acyltransferase [Streptomyces sp. NBC_00237]|uniref:acyltransferase family protein n=1 Tax=Streptomyces sp. NBC_00237 TaxID=2975687 RepID=UPI00224F03B8|nr:acyltransferase [Streptomyces sp. NBC_00237]MCX5200882.1 acyltransferase [Streptomyces sp. NBC_00237]
MSHGHPGSDGSHYPDDPGAQGYGPGYDADGFPLPQGGGRPAPAAPQQGGGGWPTVRNNPGPALPSSSYGQGQQGGFPQAYPQTGGYQQQPQQPSPQQGGWPQQTNNRRPQQGGYGQQAGTGYAGTGYAEPGYGDATTAFPPTGGGYGGPGGSGGLGGPGGPGVPGGQQEETPAFARSAVGAPTRQQPAWGRDEDAANGDPYGPGTSAWPETAGADGLGLKDAPDSPDGPSETPSSEEAPEPAPKKSGRDRYLDLLRSIALVRVVLFHVYGQAWMTIIFPSMGVMFALAGSLMARSLSARSAGQVIKSRIRRLMVPVWVFSIVTLALIFNGGWKPTAGEDGESVIWWWVRLAWWFVPVGAASGPDEVGSVGGLLDVSWAAQTSGPLWYIRAYLWFVMLSPLMLKLFRKMPWPTLLAPLALSVALGLKPGLIPGETGNAIQDFSTFASCWMLGFAHNEGTLKKLKAYMIPSFSAVLMGLGLWWAGTHIGEAGWNFDEIPTANALWSLGFCAVLLHYSPSWEVLPDKLKGFDTPITLANNRAVTIYLWHEMAIMLTLPVIDKFWELGSVPVLGELVNANLGKLYQVLMFILAWPLIAAAIATFGWAEDVAAKRKPRLWPNGAKKKARSG